MDVFTMVIMACVSGEPHCTTSRISEIGFTTAQACEDKIDAITGAMTKDFGKRPEFKGRQVTYDVSCMDRTQLARKFGVTSSDT
ncbi:MAG: hypothetical protein J0I54_18960 [Bosea sp.]|uniref:hypothetical protein n=1 Tax=unclassified Bosea (in: a-proteobacteria) TaxID=2653178 RepID=UPI00095C2711|nr:MULTISPECIES: hypothetical protein [unclassified Bosea (in: a-proteobacteria)]MBN9458717.1 hypothetical protein [Bosea sp. (in: a-proteobacteria)]OJV06634.1 MAG: hypothetical protein BGO20_14215 [Bosea sp. 67-29]